MTRGGLLFAGRVVPVDGIDIANPLDTPWAKLDARDYRMRRSPWIRQCIVHSTKGKSPQYVIPGAGAGGRDKWTADYWRGETKQSAAPIVADTDGTAGCLADLAAICAYHAQMSNDWSIGLEMYQMPDGGIYEATYDTTVKIILAVCELCSIPLQVPRAYHNRPIARMDVDGKTPGGPDMVGVFGHRDNTHSRGSGDPGDEFFRRMVAAGAEQFDFDAGEDLVTWKRRQRFLNECYGERLAVDGLAGPSTVAAMRRHGFARGLDIPA